MDKILEILKNQGPLTGKDLVQKIAADPFQVWKFCHTSDQIYRKVVGQRFLRLDKQVDGYARLSPSILREFFTYTMMGLVEDCGHVDQKALDLGRRIAGISAAKLDLAQSIAHQVTDSKAIGAEIGSQAVFFIAGDVVYGMAHADMRPEASTGQMIRGSDLDMIIVTEDVPDCIIQALDRQIYGQKYHFMKNPAYREEIDYIIKDLEKVGKQLAFNSFESMVASKILREGRFLWGSKRLYETIKGMLSRNGIPEKLKKLEKMAVLERKKAQDFLLHRPSKASNAQYSRLFFTKEESGEIF